MSPDSPGIPANQPYVLVLAGSRGTRLQQLTDPRAKPAVPFADTIRIIDFALGNCVISGRRRIAVLTQYKAQSLIRHVERSWRFLEESLGEYVDIVPAQQQVGDGWYSDTANAVFQNLSMLREAEVACELVLGGDPVYQMDCSVMVDEQVARGAEVTVACLDVPLEDARQLGVISMADDQRITGFVESEPRRVAARGVAFVRIGILWVLGRGALLSATRAMASSQALEKQTPGRPKCFSSPLGGRTPQGGGLGGALRPLHAGTSPMRQSTAGALRDGPDRQPVDGCCVPAS